MRSAYSVAKTVLFVALINGATVVGLDAMFGCSTVSPRTVNDVAQEACEVAFAIDAERIPHGKSVKEFCELHDNLQPFIDQILAAKQIAGAKNGISGADAGALDSGAP